MPHPTDPAHASTQDLAYYYTAQYNTRADAALTEATLQRWAQQSFTARKTMACVLDLPCGESSNERIDFFPANRTGAPLLIFIHGGWWRFLDKRDFSFIAPAFVQAGYNVALFNYDLCPQVSIKTIVQQQLKAFAYLYSQAQALEFDVNNIHISGHSAGAHLAAMLCCADWALLDSTLPKKPFKSATLLSGIYDLNPLPHIRVAQADLQLSASDLILLSPLTYETPTLRALIVAGGDESDEFKRQSTLLTRTWGKSVRSHDATGLSHFTIVDEWSKPTSSLHQVALKLMRSGQ